MLPMSQRNFWRLVMVAGVVIVSPDSVLIRWLVEAGVTAFAVIVWKTAFTCCFMGMYTVWAAGGPSSVLAGVPPGLFHIPPAAVLQGAVNLGFTLSLALTSAANTLLFLSMNPLWGAVLGYFVLGETLQRRTLVTLVAAVAAILVIFVPSSVQDRGAAGKHGATSLVGDCTALATGLAMALYLTTVRHAKRHAPKANMRLAGSVGAALSSLTCVALVGGEGALPGKAGFDADRPSWQFWCVMAADAACISVLYLCMTNAAEFIPAPEVGLIMLLEVVLGPLFVWVGYGDVPPWWTLVGGAMLLLALAGHEVASMRAAAAETGAAAAGAAKQVGTGADLEEATGTDEVVTAGIGGEEADNAALSAWPTVDAADKKAPAERPKARSAGGCLRRCLHFGLA